MAMDVFELDTEKIDKLVFGSLVESPNPVADKDALQHELCRQTLRKFCKLCKHVNFDPLHPQAISVVTQVMSKAEDPFSTAQSFLDMIGYEGEFMTYDADAKKLCDAIMPSVTDWINLFGFVDVESFVASAEMEGSDYFNLIASSAKEAELMISDRSVLQILLYMSPRNIPSPMMLERLMSLQGASENNLELRCLRCVSAIYNKHMSETKQYSLLYQMFHNLRPIPSFNSEIKTILMEEIESESLNGVVKSKRKLLRNIVNDIHKASRQNSLQTFEAWTIAQRFSVTTSTHLQRVLYFIHAQQGVHCPEQAYSQFFPQEILLRAANSKIEQIDSSAIIAVIKSIRVYKNDIKELLDFRCCCLAGLSLTARSKISLPGLLQLYVSCYQHDSIWEECWKSIVPVMNHTIEMSRRDFIKSHSMCIESVVKCVISCHVGV